MNLTRAVRSCTAGSGSRARSRRSFEFFEHPKNLALLTPPWLDLQLRTPGSLAMRAASRATTTCACSAG
jgi:hypothetical protein